MDSNTVQKKFKDIKINKSKLKNTTTIDKLEMPLRFLRQNEDRRLKLVSIELNHVAFVFFFSHRSGVTINSFVIGTFFSKKNLL